LLFFGRFVTMHPPLAHHKHPSCVAVIEALEECHQQHPATKFVGVCNKYAVAVDKCLTEEYHAQRAVNFKRGQQVKQELKKLEEREKEEDERIRNEILSKN